MKLVLNFWHSTVGKKVVMAVTGLIGVGFVIGHMVGNLQMFQGPEKINAYAHFLHETVGGALWAVRLVLIAAVVLHVVAAVQLTRLQRAARPAGNRYAKWEPQVSTFASRSIRWGGLFLFVWLVFHILHFTVRAVFPYSDTDVYANVVHGFSIWWVTLFYVLAMLWLGLHLYHGFWSSFRTLGLNRPSPRPLVRRAATAVAVLVWLGFTVVPVAVFAGLIKPHAARPVATSAAPGGR